MSEFDTLHDGNGVGDDTNSNGGGYAANNKAADFGVASSNSHDAFEDRDSRHKQSGSRESDRDKSRTRERERDRENDRGRHSRDSRDYKDRSLRDDRGRDKFDYDRRRSRDNDRDRDYDRDRERRHRHRSPRSDRSSHRSRSRSPSKSKRTSGFDMGPPMPGMVPGAVIPGQLPGAPQTTPGMMPNAFPFVTSLATRHARRVYVGGLPPLANEQTIATFFSQVMAAIGGNSAGPGDAVVNVYINHEKKFAFVEMRTVEEASNAMALDGIMFEGVSVRVRRPTDYNPALAAVLGPSQSSPHLNLSAVGLTPGGLGGAEGADRVFVGGLPYYFTETQIRELLESFGPLRSFDLVKDRETGNSKGYGFCIYQDPAVTDVACAALTGLKMGDKTLTLRRATASSTEVKPEQESILAQAQQHIAIQKMVLQAGGVNLPAFNTGPVATPDPPTKVLCLNQAISADDLKDDEEFKEILDDMRDECGKFGALANIVIPRPNANGEFTAGIGKVFLEYIDIDSCIRARNALNGRKFGGNTVSANFYPEDTFHNQDYSA